MSSQGRTRPGSRNITGTAAAERGQILKLAGADSHGGSGRFGAGDGIRTHDILLGRQALYH